MRIDRGPRQPSCLRWVFGLFMLMVVPSVFFCGYFSGSGLLSLVTDAPLNPATGEGLDEEIFSAETQPNTSSSSPQLSVLANRSRLTVLVMGLDRRAGENFYTRTDSIMLLSLDLRDESASILSIPRDLMVEIPGYRPDRINNAFVLGAEAGGEIGGAILAMRTVEQNLGVQVDHYALLDFVTVEKLVDQIGGVTVDVPKIIDDPTYPDNNYGFDPLYIPAGVTEMDGELALKYMRTRHQDSDFHRAGRQQQVVVAYKNKLVELGVTGILREAPDIIDELQNGFFTDLSSNDILSVLQVATDVSDLDIQTAVLDYNYVYSEAVKNRGTVLMLRQTEVQNLVAQLFD